MVFMRICVITYKSGGGTWDTDLSGTLLEVPVWVLGVGMSTLDAQTVCTPRMGASKYR